MLTGEHRSNAGRRSWRLFVPEGTRRPRGLIVMLHGCGQDAESFADLTGMNDVAGEAGFLVLYPEQATRANAWGCWNWFRPAHQHRDAGEPAIIAGMTRRVMRRHRLPPGRVAIAGFSAGGGMAMVMRRAYPELFAACAVHSGVATGLAFDGNAALGAMRGRFEEDPTRPAGPVGPPTLVLQGGADTVVHPDNADRILAELGAVAVPPIRPQGGGHDWFGGSGETASGIDASAEVLRFVEAHMTARGSVLSGLRDLIRGAVLSMRRPRALRRR